MAEAKRHTVLALPYGDVDVAAAYRSTYANVVEAATELAADTLAAHDITSSPVIDPGDGVLPWDAVDAIADTTPMVLSEAAVRGPATRVDVSALAG